MDRPLSGQEHRPRRQDRLAYGLPVVHSTVNVKTGATSRQSLSCAEVLEGVEDLDRTTINAWEDVEFVKAVKATGRKKLIMTALWTEACLSFPDARCPPRGLRGLPGRGRGRRHLRRGAPAGLERVVQAGAQPTSWVQVICELQRDWARKETAGQFAEIVFAVEGR